MSIKRFFPDTRPTLDLNFAVTKRLDPRITYTRASTGTFVDSNGLIQSAAVNQARFDHNPSTGESLGLLVEEARTNLLLNSATLSTQSVTVAAAANTLSFYGTGTVTLTGVSTAGPLVGTGANNRVSLTFTPTVGVLILTVSGSVTNAQLEAGSFSTSYIPTTIATVTRAADVASMTGTNFSSWYNQSAGTLVGEYRTPASGTRGVADFNDNTANERIGVLTNSTDPKMLAVDGGTTQVDLDGGTIVANTLAKTAIAYATNDFSIVNAGGAAVTDTSGTLPTVNCLMIGTDQTGNYQNGQTKRLTYYPVRLPDAQLQALTAT